MTVSSENQINSYSGDGNVTEFAYGFKIFDQADLEVILRDSNGAETVQTITTHYTVTGVGTDGGGNVVFVTAPASGESIYIRRLLDAVQETDYQEGAAFPAASHEEALDRLTMIAQQLQEQIDRCVKASVTTPFANPEFNDVSNDRQNKIFAFDNDGNIDVTQELGIYRGNWATGTTYKVRDIVRDSGNLNVYIVNEAHTSSGSLPISSNADASKFDILIDSTGVVSAASSAATSAAATSAAEALASQNAAAASALAASNSESSAAADALAAAGSSSDASGFATTAAGHASTASGHATTASGHATTAASEAADAAASALSAENDLAEFEQHYLGEFATDPTLDNNGGALTDGALYFDTTNATLKVYDLSTTTWLATTPSAAQLTKINTVYDDLVGSNTIGTVAADIGDIQTLAPISSDITNVAGFETDVSTVAGQIAPTNNLSTVAGISTDISTTAGDSVAIQQVSSNTTQINTVHTNIGDVTNVSSNMNAVLDVNANMSDITDVNTNMTDINDVADNLATLPTVIDAFEEYATSYLGGKTLDPTVDNDGNALANGALYYNTQSNVFKVYSQGAWVNVAVSEASAKVERTVVVGNLRFGTTAPSVTFTNQAIPVIYNIYLNGSRLLNTDFTATESGSDMVVTLTNTDDSFGAKDEVSLVGFTAFNVADVVPAGGGTFAGNLTVDNDLSVGLDLSVGGGLSVGGNVTGAGIDSIFETRRVFTEGARFGGSTNSYPPIYYEIYDPDNNLTLIDTGTWGVSSPSNYQSFSLMTRLGHTLTWNGRIRFNYSTAYNLLTNHSIGIEVPNDNTFFGNVTPYANGGSQDPNYVGRGRIDSATFGIGSSFVDIFAYQFSNVTRFIFVLTSDNGSPNTQDYIYFNINYLTSSAYTG